MTNQIPAELEDWVSLRAECTVGKIFERLKSGVEHDIGIRQTAIPAEGYPKLWVERGVGSGSFKVILDGAYKDPVTAKTTIVHSVVDFTFDQHKILVHDEDRKITYVATATLCDDGKCRLSVGGQELELWQFRKRALEGLLFNEYLP